MYTHLDEAVSLTLGSNIALSNSSMAWMSILSLPLGEAASGDREMERRKSTWGWSPLLLPLLAAPPADALSLPR